MVMKKLIPAIFFLSIISIQTQARVVENIEIKETGFHDSSRRADYEYEKESCKEFNPTKEQLIRFFKVAEEANGSGTWLHEYYSPCLATGTVTFKDGTSGEWMLQSSGLGDVTFKNKETTYFFHKDNTWTDPFACTYGLSDEPEPGC